MSTPQLKLQKISSRRKQFNALPKQLMENIQFMDYKIRKQFTSFTLLSLCGADRANFMVEPSFERAFGALSLDEKIDYYGGYVDNVDKCEHKLRKKDQDPGESEDKSKSTQINVPLKIGKANKVLQQTEIVIENYRAKSTSSAGKAYFDIDLHSYLIRKSKKKNQPTFILESIRTSTPETIRFAFRTSSEQLKFLPIITECLNQTQCNNIMRQLREYRKKRKPDNSLQPMIKLKTDEKEVIVNLPDPKVISRNESVASKMNLSVISDIVKDREQQQLDQELTEFIEEQNEEAQRAQSELRKASTYKKTYQYKNILKIILPNYSLAELPVLNHYGSVYESKICDLYIYQNSKESTRFKMQFTVDLPLHITCKAIYNVQLYKNWHPVVGEGQIKLKITSENSCITYEKIKSFSEWYRERDYLQLIHMFKQANSYYIVQRSIEHSSFIPFQAITRGQIDQIVWRVEQKPGSDSQCRVMMEIKADHRGLLNKNQQKELTVRYLKGFEIMGAYFKNKDHQDKLTHILDFEWQISEKDSQNHPEHRKSMKNNSLATVNFQDETSQISQSQVFYSIYDMSDQEDTQAKDPVQEQQRSEHEIEPKPENPLANSQFINNQEVEDIKLNEDGLVILPKKYLKKKHLMTFFETELKKVQFTYNNIVEKDDWVIQKNGGLRLVNPAKIEAQNNVFKFIMKTLKKNLFSGKGILNISLPVQIFNVDSNLQRTCQALSLGPHFLEKAAKTSDIVERFKQALAFGLSNTIIYFDVEKPFNPILGQTYQGFIRGCPVYAEQISHHPPITSIYFIGRGYKITANLQAKVNIGMNSGAGVNEGFYHIIFDDRHEILYQTPPGELSGLAVGDRRFNINGRGYYVDLKNNLFCEMKVQNSGGMFSKKKNEFADALDGQICRVKPQFLSKFMSMPLPEKPSPKAGDILQKFGEISGRWPFEMRVGGVKYYDIRADIPDKMIDDVYPLNSNSNYREDLLYRKKCDLSRSQIEKERLEVIQRGDRKLRQKFHGKAH